MRKLILVAGLVVLAIACSEPVGEMLIDAGEMMRDGGVADASTMPDGSIGGGGTTGSGGMATGGTTGSGGMATGGTTGSGGMATGGTSGSGGSPGADVSVTCNKSGTDQGVGYTYRWRWAEFDVDPGVTEVTVCRAADTTWPNSAWGRSTCYRSKATWLAGTSTGIVGCGNLLDYDDPDTPDRDTLDPISITVHR